MRGFFLFLQKHIGVTYEICHNKNENDVRGEDYMTTIKVAIADDNRELVHQIELYFQNHAQIEIVATASNGEVCLTMLEEHDIDLLLLDLIMPYMDGIAVLEHIRAHERYGNLSIMMLTAFGQEEVMKNIVDLGATYLILKPFDFKQLESKILKWARMEIRTSTNELEEVSPLDAYVRHLLDDVGIPVHMRGYKYLCKAIIMVYDNPQLLHGSITKTLYPNIGACFNASASSVERAIRNAITSAWARETTAMQQVLQHATASFDVKPKNSEFIAFAVKHTQHQFLEQSSEPIHT